METTVAREILILLACATAIIPFFHRLRIPAVVGFLLTGVLVGPGVLNLVGASPRLDSLAEIGVAMLLFTIGLEFSRDRVRDISRHFWLGGGAQVLLTSAAVLLAALGAGIPASRGLFYGLLVSLSSTVVVLRLLGDRAELHAPQGRLALGILLFQDLGMVPMMIAVPFLAGTAGSPGALLAVARQAVPLLAILLAVHWLAPRALGIVIRTGIREIHVMSALLLCLGMSWVTASFGFSAALGAFLAGILISESRYSHQIAADILPFRDLFNGIFFITIGMLLDLQLVRHQFGPLLALALLVLAGKSLLATMVARWLHFPWRIAVLTGLALSQIGEFSFVLARLGLAQGLLTRATFQGFMAVAVLTILATPLLMAAAPRLSSLWSRGRAVPAVTDPRAAGVPPVMTGHVLIAGYGLNGRNLARVLQAAAIPFTVVEFDFERVRACGEAGIAVVAGDVCSREILLQAGAARCKVFVGAISDPAATRTVLRLVRDLNPGVRTIIRSRYVSEIEALYRDGADQVIPEEFETSIEIFTRTLAEYHIPRNLIQAQTEIVRSEGYAVMRGTGRGPQFNEKIAELLDLGTVETFMVLAGQSAVSRTLRELDIRNRTGVTVIALVRSDRPLISPPPDTTLRERDILVLVGDHRGIDETVAFLGRHDG